MHGQRFEELLAAECRKFLGLLAHYLSCRSNIVGKGFPWTWSLCRDSIYHGVSWFSQCLMDGKFSWDFQCLSRSFPICITLKAKRCCPVNSLTISIFLDLTLWKVTNIDEREGSAFSNISSWGFMKQRKNSKQQRCNLLGGSGQKLWKVPHKNNSYIFRWEWSL